MQKKEEKAASLRDALGQTGVCNGDEAGRLYGCGDCDGPDFQCAAGD